MHGGYEGYVEKGIRYLLRQRSSRGCFRSTHDTAVAFQALNSYSLGGVKNLKLEVFVGGVRVSVLQLGSGDNDATYLIDLKPYLKESPELVLRSAGEGVVLYQLCWQEHLPWEASGGVGSAGEQLTLNVTYDTTYVEVNDKVRAAVELQYNGSKAELQMVLIDLRAPVGFSFDESEFAMLLAEGVISHYEIRGRQALVYVDELPRASPVSFTYSLTANMAVRALAQAVCAYDMYDPALVSHVGPVRMTASQAGTIVAE
jgi:hypothetical protein